MSERKNCEPDRRYRRRPRMIRSAPASIASAFTPEAGSISGTTAAIATDAAPMPNRAIPATFIHLFIFICTSPIVLTLQQLSMRVCQGKRQDNSSRLPEPESQQYYKFRCAKKPAKYSTLYPACTIAAAAVDPVLYRVYPKTQPAMKISSTYCHDH